MRYWTLSPGRLRSGVCVYIEFVYMISYTHAICNVVADVSAHIDTYIYGIFTEYCVR